MFCENVLSLTVKGLVKLNGLSCICWLSLIWQLYQHVWYNHRNGDSWFVFKII